MHDMDGLSDVSSYHPRSFHPLNDATPGSASLSRGYSSRSNLTSVSQTQGPQFYITSAPLAPASAPSHVLPVVDRVRELDEFPLGGGGLRPLSSVERVHPKYRRGRGRSGIFWGTSSSMYAYPLTSVEVCPSGASGSAVTTLSPLSRRLMREQEAAQRQQRLLRSSPYVGVHACYADYCKTHTIDRDFRDWNEDFQTMYSFVRDGQLWGTDRRERLRMFLESFETHCQKIVEAMFAEHKDAGGPARPTRVPGGLTRHGNVLIKVWRDAKMGANLQRCYEAVMLSRIRSLTVPLTATFTYLNVSVTAFAMIPLDPRRPAEYQGVLAPTAGGVVNRPLEEYLLGLQEALNITVERDDQRVVPMEVYESLDTRFYVLNPFGLVPQLTPRTPAAARRESADTATAARPSTTVSNFASETMTPQAGPAAGATSADTEEAAASATTALGPQPLPLTGGCARSSANTSSTSHLPYNEDGSDKQQGNADNTTPGPPPPVSAHTAVPETLASSTDVPTIDIDGRNSVGKRNSAATTTGAAPLLVAAPPSRAGALAWAAEDGPTARPRAAPLRRVQHMLTAPPCAPGTVPWRLYMEEADQLARELPAVLSANKNDRNDRLVQMLHARGMNVCLLGMVAQSILRVPKEEWNEHTEPLLRCVESEIVARAIRRLMLLQMTVEKAALSLKSINMYLARTTGSLLQLTPATFASGLLPQIRDMFVLAADASAELLMRSLETTVLEQTVTITRRVCQLCALQMSRGAVTQVMVRPSRHNLSSIIGPEIDALHSRLLKRAITSAAAAASAPANGDAAAVVSPGPATPPPDTHDGEDRQPPPRHRSITSTTGSATDASAGRPSPHPPPPRRDPVAAFESAFLLPLQMDCLARSGRLGDAWARAKQLVRLRGADPARQFFRADAWAKASSIATLCGAYDDAVALVDSAIRVVETIPAYVISSGDAAAAAAAAGGGALVPLAKRRQHLPTNFYYLREQALLQCAKGHVYTSMSYIDEAERCFRGVLAIVDSMELQTTPYVAHLRQSAVLGLFEIMLVAPEKDRIKSIELLWVQESGVMPPSLTGAHISELFGMLFLRRELYAPACLRLWDAYQTITHLLGTQSREAAELLNKIAFAYSNWDLARYGLYSSCLLHLAAAITEGVFGTLSPNHVAVIENTIALFIARKMFVVASVRLNHLRTMPPRFAARIPRDHPVMLQLVELHARLRHEFLPAAVLMIQRFWRDNRERQLQRAVCESSAGEIQRVGRAFLIRVEVQRLRAGTTTLPRILQRERLYTATNYSHVLLKASAFFSREKRNWCFEYDHYRLFGEYTSSAAAHAYTAALDSVEHAFRASVEAIVGSVAAEPSLYRRVPGTITSFVVDNVLLMRIAAGDEYATLQHKLFSLIRRIPDSLVSAPLSAIVSAGEAVHFFAIALLPLHKRPHFAYAADAHERAYNNQLVGERVEGFLDASRRLGLVPEQDTVSTQWIDVVKAKNEVFYFTNALGLASRVVLESVSAAPLLSLTALDTVDSTVFQLCGEDKPRAATELLEQRILNGSASPASRTTLHNLFLLCVTRAAEGSDTDAVMKLYRGTAAQYEMQHEYLSAVVTNYSAGRQMLRLQLARHAIDPLRRNIHLLLDKVRGDSCYAAMYLLESVRLLLRASAECDRPMDSTEVRTVVAAAETAEDTALLFITCEEYIAASKRFGDTDTAEALEATSDQNAKALVPDKASVVIEDLVRRSDACAARDAADSLSAAVVFISAAIRVSQAQGEEDARLGTLLCSHGALMTRLGNLHRARRSLGKAHHILSRETHANSAEMQAWRRHSKVLKERIRENALRIIRRAVRQYKERQRLERELAVSDPEQYQQLVRLRLGRRLGRLVVREGTLRVLVADAEVEERYVLQRRQYRMRQEAIMRQTYGVRLQIYLDKLSSAMDDLVAYALAVKEAAAEGFWRQRHVVLTSFLLGAHKLERRSAFREMGLCRIQLKLWHIENVDAVIRLEFTRLYQGFILRLAAVEETLWRRVIAKMQKKTKRLISRAISRALRARPRKSLVDLINDLEYEEDQQRVVIEEEEDQLFAGMMEVYTFGPEVLVEDSDDD